MKTYFAFLADENGEPSTVEVGGGRDENTAAKSGIRMANVHRQNVAIVEKDTVSGKQRTCQMIRYIQADEIGEGYVLAPRQPDPPVQLGKTERYYLSLCKPSDPILWKFVRDYIDRGFSVTLSPSNFEPTLFNAVAVRHS